MDLKGLMVFKYDRGLRLTMVCNRYTLFLRDLSWHKRDEVSTGNYLVQNAAFSQSYANLKLGVQN